MKILMITPYLPYPLYSGGQIRSFNLLKQLSKNHKITLISFIRQAEEKKYLAKLRPYTQAIYTIQRRPAWDLRNLFLTALSPYPFLVSIYYSPALKKLIKKLLNQNQYDLIHAETFYVLPNLPKTKLPVLLVEQTIEYLVYQRVSQNLRLPFLKPLLEIDVNKLKYWEKHYWASITKLATVSLEDKNFINQKVNRTDIEVVENGVDFDDFKNVFEINIKRAKGKNVLFLGNFKWLPNREAVNFLVKYVWSGLHRRFPTAKLFIVGRHPTKQILDLNNKALNINVIGEVNDIKQILSYTDLMLVPILNGRGTKYKVLESIADGIPIVGTPLAVEGLPLKPGIDVFTGQKPQELINLATKVLSQPTLGRQMSKQALNKLKKHLTWQKVSTKLNQIYYQLASK